MGFVSASETASGKPRTNSHDPNQGAYKVKGKRQKTKIEEKALNSHFALDLNDGSRQKAKGKRQL